MAALTSGSPMPATAIPRTRPTPADVATILNGVAGFVGLALVAHLALDDTTGRLDDDALVPIVVCYLVGVVLDLVDGPIARRTGSSGLGSVLDTISDVVTFALLPAVTLVARTDHRATAGFVIAACACFVFAAILRLARHEAREAAEAEAAAREGRAPCKQPFRGMPTPIGANCLIALAGLAPAAPVAAGIVLVLALLLNGDFPFPDSSSFGGLYAAAMVVLTALALAGVVGYAPVAFVALGTLIPTALLNLVRTRAGG